MLRRASRSTLLPWHLKRHLQRDQEALASCGPDAPGLAVSIIGRLKAWWDAKPRKSATFGSATSIFGPTGSTSRLAWTDKQWSGDSSAPTPSPRASSAWRRYRESAQSEELRLISCAGAWRPIPSAVGDGADWAPGRRYARFTERLSAALLGPRPPSSTRCPNQLQEEGHLHDIWSRADAEGLPSSSQPSSPLTKSVVADSI